MKPVSTYRLLLFLGCLFLSQFIYAQITVIINELPENHDYSKSIYISGDFEGWSGGQEAYKLVQEDKTYRISLSTSRDIIQYKFTMGSWESVEKDAEGNNTDNRIYDRKTDGDTIYVKIVRWEKANEGNDRTSTAAKNVSILSESFDMPELDRSRRIWMYLPPDYNSSAERYPVLYIHDGQNVFDDLTSYAGEWGVDETLNRLYRKHNFKLIVVAIDNGGDLRMNEYAPWSNERFGQAEGEAYISFIANTLKPYIDTQFRTLSDSKNTGIIGSSLGGLITHYAALKYPTVFGKSGIFSPSFWYAKEAYDFATQHSALNNSEMYFLAGGRESETMVPDMLKMVALMKAEGFNKDGIKHKVVEEGIHNEKFWKDEFEEAIMWLFPNAIKHRKFKDARLLDNHQLEVDVSDGKYVIRFYAPEIVETSFVPNGQEFKKESHAVSMSPRTDFKYDYKADSGKISFGSMDLSVQIDKNSFRISYVKDGEIFSSENTGYQKNDDYETISLSITDDEILYGGGARALGMNRRGNRLRLYNKADYGYETESALMNYTMPVAMSSKGYLVHFDNAPIGYLDLDSRAENTLTYETISGRKTYQIVVGDSWEDLIDNYTDLTAKQPMPPRWALGNFSSRFGYHSEEETRNTVNKFKEYNIPLDAVIIDIYWFGKDIQGHMGNLEWLRDSFPNPKQMMKDFKKQGVKTILVSEPFILTTSKRWDEAVEEDVLAKDSLGNPFRFNFYFGNTGLIDIYKPKARDWFWNIYKGLTEQGVDGVWGDLGEPEVHPSGLIHATGTADEVHNIYGHDWARLVYEGYARDFPDKRPFILMRSGYSGSQRFGLIPWSGDVNRTWGGLQSQTEIALQMGMQGLGYMHSDLGGFAGANLDDELYTRWLQYGVFQPIFRPHAQEEVPSEPVFRERKTRELAKRSIELRYKLLPYNYNLSFQNNQKGMPLMRPLFFEDPSKWTYENSETYLWGNDILVSPIVNSGVTEKEIYFPKNNVWFNFYNKTKIVGGQSKIIKVSEASIPTYVRAGAFIPLTKLVQNTDQYAFNDFQLFYYFDTSVAVSNREFYNDDGSTNQAFEKGSYEILKFNGNYKDQTLLISMDAELGSDYKAEVKTIELIIPNIVEPIKHIKLNGRKIRNSNLSSDNLLSIPVKWHTADKLNLEIKFKK